MSVTLAFPSYILLAEFLSFSVNTDIDMNIDAMTLTANFSDNEVRLAIGSFKAQLSAQ